MSDRASNLALARLTPDTTRRSPADPPVKGARLCERVKWDDAGRPTLHTSHGLHRVETACLHGSLSGNVPGMDGSASFNAAWSSTAASPESGVLDSRGQASRLVGNELAGAPQARSSGVSSRSGAVGSALRTSGWHLRTLPTSSARAKPIRAEGIATNRRQP